MLEEVYYRLRLNRKDFQVILGLFLIDIALTIYGISSGAGSEMSPFFRSFTDTLTLMVAGGLVYMGILSALNYFLEGAVRTVLAAAAIGMHIGGIFSWVWLFAGFETGHSALYLNYMLIAASTAGAYSFLESRDWIY